MTNEQRQRIQSAARELGAALSDLPGGHEAFVSCEAVPVSTVGDPAPRSVYSVTVRIITGEDVL